MSAPRPETYEVLSSFTEFANPGQIAADGTSVGIITGASLTPPTGEEQPGQLSVALNCVHDAYVPHSYLWDKANIPDSPYRTAAKLVFDNTVFGIGGSYQWNPSRGRAGELNIYLALIQPRLLRFFVPDANPEGFKRLADLLSLAIGTAVLNHLDVNPAAVYRYTAFPGEMGETAYGAPRTLAVGLEEAANGPNALGVTLIEAEDKHVAHRTFDNPGKNR